MTAYDGMSASVAGFAVSGQSGAFRTTVAVM